MLKDMHYRPVPRGLWMALGLNTVMVLWNFAFLSALGRPLDVALTTVSSICCIYILQVIARWRAASPPI